MPPQGLAPPTPMYYTFIAVIVALKYLIFFFLAGARSTQKLIVLGWHRGAAFKQLTSSHSHSISYLFCFRSLRLVLRIGDC